jgi:hypothetical protein
LIISTAMASYYVVFKGRVPGIYFTWQECSKHVLHFKGDVHKRYDTYDEAVAAYMATHPTASASEIVPCGEIEMHVGDCAPAPQVEIASADGYMCCSMRVLCLSCAFFYSNMWFKKTFS